MRNTIDDPLRHDRLKIRLEDYKTTVKNYCTLADTAHTTGLKREIEAWERANTTSKYLKITYEKMNSEIKLADRTETSHAESVGEHAWGLSQWSCGCG
jgi:hypothetical protein